MTEDKIPFLHRREEQLSIQLKNLSELNQSHFDQKLFRKLNLLAGQYAESLVRKREELARQTRLGWPP